MVRIPEVAAGARRVQRFRLRHLAQTRLWLVPLTCLLVGIGLAVALLSVDRSSGFHIVGTSVTGSAASVQTILTAASTSLVTLTSVVLSLTLVAVQLAMGQEPTVDRAAHRRNGRPPRRTPGRRLPRARYPH